MRRSQTRNKNMHKIFSFTLNLKNDLILQQCCVWRMCMVSMLKTWKRIKEQQTMQILFLRKIVCNFKFTGNFWSVTCDKFAIANNKYKFCENVGSTKLLSFIRKKNNKKRIFTNIYRFLEKNSNITERKSCRLSITKFIVYEFGEKNAYRFRRILWK